MTNLKLKVVGEFLAASEDSRTLKYKLLPFGTKSGLTKSGHRFSANKGAVKIPRDISHLIVNTHHNQAEPVGRFVEVEEKDDAIYASIRISEFERGDETLQAVMGGMHGCSIEVRNPVIRDGVLLGGELTGMALTPTPSIPTALLTASDMGSVEEAIEGVESALSVLKTALETNSEAPAEEEIDSDEESEEVHPFTDSSEEEEELKKKGLTAMENNSVPTALTASNGGSAEITTLATGTGLLASAFKSGDKRLLDAMEELGAIGERNLFAAANADLADVTVADSAVSRPNTWLGQAWDQKAYTRKFTGLVTNKTLTGRTMQGWRFTQKPVVAAYAGFPNAIPTNPVATESFTITSERWAGGNDIDRSYIDFNDSEFLQAYYTAQAESYARVTDLRVLSALTTSSVEMEPGTVGAGTSVAASHIVDGALALIEEDTYTPTAALVPRALYREFLLTKEQDSLKYLSIALGFEGGSLNGFQIIPADVPNVIVLSKDAVSFYELGGSPIRVEVQNPSIGGFTTALFGYTAVDADNRGIKAVIPAP